MADRTATYRFRGDVSSLSASTRKAGSDVRGLGTNLQSAGRHADSMGSRFRRAAVGGAGLVAAFGIGKLVKDSVQLEASFSKTLSQIAVATGAPKSALKGLHDTAMKMGADTVFSAGEAADAMLELAKSGISTRDIMGGGIKGTLTLAAAGSLDLASAATIASNAMNTFHLRGKDMGTIAAALAGGANASTASVESLGQALSQVGPGARNAGLSLQETVGTLAAFDQAGIKGSDAGTSLKTMLTRLIPSTKSAKTAMADLGLSFVDQHGNIDDITVVAQKLQDKLSGLSQEQRTTALQTIFGSDATRAATVLMNDGAKGLEKFIKATRDQGAAQRMAKANMSGTAGALEQLSGSVDTAKIKLGEALAPTVRKLAHFLSATAVPAFSKFIDQMKSGKGTGGAVAGTLEEIWHAGGKVVDVMGHVAKAFDSLPSWAKQTIAVGGVGTIAAKKLGLLPTLGKIGSKALGGSLTGGVQKVFVTNPGFGKVGPGGTPIGGPGGKGPKGRVLPNSLLTASPYLLPLLLGGDAPPPRPNAQHTNMTAGVHSLSSQLGADNFGFKGGKSSDDLLSGIFKSDPAKGFRTIQTAAAAAHMSVSDFTGAISKGFPKTKQEIDNAGGSMSAFQKRSRNTKDAVDRLATDLTGVSTAARKSGIGVHAFRQKLSTLPKGVQTKVTTPGAIKSRADITALDKKYHLTKKQVQTLIQLLGGPRAIKGLNDVGRNADRVGGKHPNVTVSANTGGAVRQIDSVLSKLGQIHDQSATITTYYRSLGKKKAGGGPVAGPGSGTSDSVPILASNGEFVMRAAAVQQYGLDRMQAMNSLRYAGGGSIGGGSSTTRSSSGPVVVHVYDANDHLIGSMRGIAQGVTDDSRDFDSTLARRSA